MDGKQHITKGQKRIQIYKNLIKPVLPNNLSELTYVEPFGGSFAIGNFLEVRPKVTVYNDIKEYDIKIDSTFYEQSDFEECIKKYDSEDTIFYLDPPYYGKEDWYGGTKFDVDFHARLKKCLDQIKGKAIISYETCIFINGLYRDWKLVTYPDKSDKRFSKEQIFINYSI